MGGSGDTVNREVQIVRVGGGAAVGPRTLWTLFQAAVLSPSHISSSAEALGVPHLDQKIKGRLWENRAPRKITATFRRQAL